MELEDRIKAFVELGEKLNEWVKSYHEEKPSPLDSILRQAFHKNGWFEESQVINSISGVIPWLSKENLTNWVGTRFVDFGSSQKIGVIMAGNIPMVGFHDYLSVLISGHQLVAKLSSKDEVILKFIQSELEKIEPRIADFVDFTSNRFNEVDAVIATGSDNSSRYFEYYFSKKPHIIRKNRTSIAVLKGDESKEELEALGYDIFNYFGLGCRSVTKLFFPKGFEVDWFYSGIVNHGGIINNHKYQNNYDYHKSLYLLNGDKLWDNNFLLLKPDTAISSPVGTIFYEEYEDLGELETQFDSMGDQIQCRVGVNGLPFGASQKPELTDYADNIDVLEFLDKL